MIGKLLITLQQNGSSKVAEQAGNSFIADIQTGALLGFTATLIGSFGIWYLNKRNRKKRLRKAIIAELEKQEEKIGRIVESLSTDGAVGLEDETDSYEIDASDLPPSGSLPTTIYQSNASNLGELPNEEVKDIVSYYSTLQTQKATIEAIRDNEEVLSADKRAIHNEMPELNIKREKLVSKLNRGVLKRLKFW